MLDYKGGLNLMRCFYFFFFYQHSFLGVFVIWLSKAGNVDFLMLRKRLLCGYHSHFKPSEPVLDLTEGHLSISGVSGQETQMRRPARGLLSQCARTYGGES